MVFLLNLTVATSDIAVDGYATDILNQSERPWGNTIQATGYIVGHMMGAGFFLIVYQHLGWSHTLRIITGLQFVLTLPVVFHRESSPVNCLERDESEGEFIPSARAFLRLRSIHWLLFFLLLLGIVEGGGDQLRLTTLTDLGLSPQKLGEIQLWIGSPLFIVGAIAGGALLSRLGTLQVFIMGCLMTVGLCGVSAILAQGMCSLYWGAATMLGSEKLISGVVMVLVYSLIMSLSVGRQAATSYAVLSSLYHVVLLSVLPVTGFLGDVAGYAVIFTGMGTFNIVILFLGSYILRYRLNGSYWTYKSIC